MNPDEDLDDERAWITATLRRRTFRKMILDNEKKEKEAYQLKQCKQCTKLFALSKTAMGWYEDKNLDLPGRCNRCRKESKQSHKLPATPPTIIHYQTSPSKITPPKLDIDKLSGTLEDADKNSKNYKDYPSLLKTSESSQRQCVECNDTFDLDQDAVSWYVNHALLEPRRCEPCRKLNKLSRTSSITKSKTPPVSESHEAQRSASDQATSTNMPSLDSSSCDMTSGRD